MAGSAGSRARLVAQVRAGVRDGRVDAPVTVVLEGRARAGADEGLDDQVEVVHASGEGDDTIVSIAQSSDDVVVVVTADRALAERAREVGADVLGPRWLLDQLGDGT